MSEPLQDSTLQNNTPHPLQDRALALAGLVQALAQVRRIADTGQADARVLATAMDSIFHIDAASPAVCSAAVKRYDRD